MIKVATGNVFYLVSWYYKEAIHQISERITLYSHVSHNSIWLRGRATFLCPGFSEN